MARMTTAQLEHLQEAVLKKARAILFLKKTLSPVTFIIHDRSRSTAPLFFSGPCADLPTHESEACVVFRGAWPSYFLDAMEVLDLPGPSSAAISRNVRRKNGRGKDFDARMMAAFCATRDQTMEAIGEWILAELCHRLTPYAQVSIDEVWALPSHTATCDHGDLSKHPEAVEALGSILSLADGSHRSVTIPFRRKTPGDDSSPIIGFGEPVVGIVNLHPPAPSIH